MANMTTQTTTAPTDTAPTGLDPRPAFATAVATARSVLAGVRPDQFDGSTPCPDFDVRTLAGHIVGVVARVAHVGTGGNFDDAPASAEGVVDADLLAAFDDRNAAYQQVWADDAVLARLLTLPWAQMPGWVALSIYVSEVSVHTWDLAVATAQDVHWDDDVLRLALDAMQQGLPAEGRDDPFIPFDPVVEVPADATVIDRLVAWNGRRP